MPSVKSTKETTNYARLCRLLVDIGSLALRDIFDGIHPPAGLCSELAPGTSAHNTLQLLSNNRILNPTQWAILYPAVSSSVSSKDFDITLLMVLLRNICSLTPPITGWDQFPSAADTSTEANIARVKYYRNTVYGHATQASVDDATFNTLWKDIRKVLVALGGASYGGDIDKLRNESMDPVIEEKYKKLLKQWKEYEDSIKEQLQKMEDTIRNDLEQVRSDLGNMDGKLDTLMAQKEAQDEDRSDLKEMKQEIQTIRERLNEVSTKDQYDKGFFVTLMRRLHAVEKRLCMEGEGDLPPENGSKETLASVEPEQRAHVNNNNEDSSVQDPAQHLRDQDGDASVHRRNNDGPPAEAPGGETDDEGTDPNDVLPQDSSGYDSHQKQVSEHHGRLPRRIRTQQRSSRETAASPSAANQSENRDISETETSQQETRRGTLGPNVRQYKYSRTLSLKQVPKPDLINSQ